MNNFDFIGHSGLIRLGIFFAVLIMMMVWEWISPRRALRADRARRWGANLGLVVMDGALLRLLIPFAALELSVLAQEQGWGLLNSVDWPSWMEIVVAVVVFDFVVYVQHVLFHYLPVLWRLHQVHHTDIDFDTTTGVRFHPIEILLSMGIKMTTVLVLGPCALAVILFEIILNGTSLFNHGNVRIPFSVDGLIRTVFVTPDMHRVHHSVLPQETNSNFGFNFSWWDKLCGTYIAQPTSSHTSMDIGLKSYRDPQRLGLVSLLYLPLQQLKKIA